MKHVFYKTGDPDTPPQIQDRNGAVVLSLCRHCGQAEGTLEEFCPVLVDAEIDSKLKSVGSFEESVSELRSLLGYPEGEEPPIQEKAVDEDRH